MTDPQPVEDPDANLTDDEKVQRDRVKRWVGQAFRDTITELRSEAAKTEPEDDTPKRTQPKTRGNIITSLFGG